MKLTRLNLPKGTVFDVGTPDDRRRRFAAPRRSTNAEVKSLDAMVNVRSSCTVVFYVYNYFLYIRWDGCSRAGAGHTHNTTTYLLLILPCVALVDAYLPSPHAGFHQHRRVPSHLSQRLQSNRVPEDTNDVQSLMRALACTGYFPMSHMYSSPSFLVRVLHYQAFF